MINLNIQTNADLIAVILMYVGIACALAMPLAGGAMALREMWKGRRQ